MIRLISLLSQRLILLVALLLCASAIIVAQGGGAIQAKAATDPHVPEKGSVERKAIVDALRVPVEKAVKQPIYVIGATDVPYVEWDKKYGAPKGIFP